MARLRFGPFQGGLHTAVEPSLLLPSMAQNCLNTDTRTGAVKGMRLISSEDEATTPVFTGTGCGTFGLSTRTIHWGATHGWIFSDNYTCALNHRERHTYLTVKDDYPRDLSLGSDDSTVRNWQLGLPAPAVSQARPFSLTTIPAPLGTSQFAGGTYRYFVTVKTVDGLESNPWQGDSTIWTEKGDYTVVNFASLPSEIPQERFQSFRLWRTKANDQEGKAYFQVEVTAAQLPFTFTDKGQFGYSNGVWVGDDSWEHLTWGVGGRSSASVLVEDHSPAPKLTKLSNEFHSAKGGDDTLDGGIVFGACGKTARWSKLGYTDYWPVLNTYDLPSEVEAVYTSGAYTYYYTAEAIYQASGIDDESVEWLKANAAYGVRPYCGRTIADTPWGMFFLSDAGLACFTGTDCIILSEGIIHPAFWSGIQASATNRPFAYYTGNQYVLCHSTGTLVVDLSLGLKGIAITPCDQVILAACPTDKKKYSAPQNLTDLHFRLYTLVSLDSTAKLRLWDAQVTQTVPSMGKIGDPLGSVRMEDLSAKRVLSVLSDDRGITFSAHNDDYTAMLFGHLAADNTRTTWQDTLIDDRYSDYFHAGSPVAYFRRGDDLFAIGQRYSTGRSAALRFPDGVIGNGPDARYSVRETDIWGCPLVGIRQAELLPDGRLLVTGAGFGLVALDWNDQTNELTGFAGGDIVDYVLVRPVAEGKTSWFALAENGTVAYLLCESVLHKIDVTRNPLNTGAVLWSRTIDWASGCKGLAIDPDGKLWFGGIATGEPSVYSLFQVDVSGHALLKRKEVRTSGAHSIEALQADDEAGGLWWTGGSQYAISGFLPYNSSTIRYLVFNGSQQTLEGGAVALSAGASGTAVGTDTGPFNTDHSVFTFRRSETILGQSWIWVTGEQTARAPDLMKRWKRLWIKKGNPLDVIWIEVFIDGRCVFRTSGDTWLPPGLFGYAMFLRVLGGAGSLLRVEVEYELFDPFSDGQEKLTVSTERERSD